VTEEEQRAAGRAEAERRITEIMGAPDDVAQPGPSGPAMDSPQWSAARLAGQLMAQSDAKDALRAKEQPYIDVYDAVAAEKRGRWLQQAAMNAPAERLGRAEGTVIQLPHGALALATMDKSGAIQRLAPVVLGAETIGPADWDRREAEWQARTRVAENELLARAYSAETCVAEGLMSAVEADALDPVRSRHVPMLPGIA